MFALGYIYIYTYGIDPILIKFLAVIMTPGCSPVVRTHFHRSRLPRLREKLKERERERRTERKIRESKRESFFGQNIGDRLRDNTLSQLLWNTEAYIRPLRQTIDPHITKSYARTWVLPLTNAGNFIVFAAYDQME